MCFHRRNNCHLYELGWENMISAHVKMTFRGFCHLLYQEGFTLKVSGPLRVGVRVADIRP